MLQTARNVFFIFSLFLTVAVSAQTYTQVTNTSGTATYGAVDVTVTTSGGSSITPCGTTSSPYFLTNNGDSYSYNFSSSVSSLRIELLFAPSASNGVVHFEVNGTPYALSAANLIGGVTPNCGDPSIISISGGNATDNGSVSIPTGEIEINGTINSLSVNLADDNSVVYGVFFATNNIPTFTGGATQMLNVCENGTSPINSLLAVDDADAGQTETWMLSTPAHGLVAATYSVTSTGSTLTPTGLTYTPFSGYSGADTFQVIVDDGIGGKDTTDVYVTVFPAPAPITGTTFEVCQNSTITLSDADLGGAWSSTDNSVATVGTAGDVTGFSDGTAVIIYTLPNSCVTTAEVTVNPLPSLSLGLDPAVCPGSPEADLAYTGLTNATTGTSTYSIDWDVAALGAGYLDVTNSSLPAIAFPIANPTGVASGAYNGVLTINNGTCTSDPYSFTLTIITLDTLTSTLTPAAICDGSLFHYEPATGMTGTTLSWSRDTVVGISNSPATGADTVNEILFNTTTSPLAVTYNYYLFNNGCTDTQHVVVMVNPTPVLTSTASSIICNHTEFVHIPASATPGTTFAWHRDAVTGISNPAADGVDSVHETLHNTADTALVVTYIDTLKANGCINTQAITVTVNPTPTLISSLTPPSICDSTVFSYVPMSAAAGVTYSWSRSAVTGIANTAATGTDNPLEALDNTTTSPIPVAYIYTLAIGTCTNEQTVNVTVNPKPELSNTTTTFSVCDSAHITFTPTGTVTGSTFAWTRAFVVGIGALPGSGSGDVDEYLKNNTYFNTPVTYVYTVTANGCSSTKNITVTIHPTPTLSSALTGNVCSGVMYNYTATSNTPGATFAWDRAAVTGITPTSASGTGSIHETLSNGTLLPTAVTYVYTLNINGCPHTQNLVVTVNPAPVTASITTMPPSSVCSNTMYANFGAAAPPSTGFSYHWTATNASIYAVGTDRQYCLVNLTNTGDAVITLTTTHTSSGCSTPSSVTVNVNSNVSAQPYVTYNSHVFYCLQNDVDGYQWGYDNKTTLDSVIIPGQVDQTYVISGEPDFANRSYWVMTMQNGCTKKSYYNIPDPTAVGNVNAEAGTMKVYPNPAEAIINIELAETTSGNVVYEIVNMLGQKMQRTEATGKTTSINIGNLAPGYYLVECLRDGVKVTTNRFIKN